MPTCARSIRVSLLLPTLLLSQTATTSRLSGVVNDDSGKPLAGAFVTAIGQSTGHATYNTTTDPNGSYSFSNITPDKYAICVQSPAGARLNNCQWSTPTQLTAAANQASTQNLTLPQGAILEVLVNDPQKLIARDDDLLIAVHLPSGAFYPMPVATSNAAMRTYECAVPLRTSLRISVVSRHLQLADDKANSLAPLNGAPSATSSTLTFPGQSALHGPPVTLTITGRK